MKRLLEKIKLNKSLEKSKDFLDSVFFCFSVSWKVSKKFLTLRVLIELIMSVLPFVSLYIGKEVINLFVGIASRKVGTNESIKQFVLLIIALFVIDYLNRIMQKIKECWGSIHKDMISKHINTQMAEKSVSLDISFFDSAEFYDKVMNARRDSYSIETLTWFVIDIVRICIQFLASLAMLAQINIVFALILVLTGIPAIMTERKFTTIAYDWQRKNASSERKMEYVLGILTGRMFAKDVRLYSLQGEMVSLYNKFWGKWFSEKTRITINKSKWASILAIAPEISQFAMLFYIGINIILGKLTVGDYSLYSGIIYQLIGSIFMFIILIGQINDNNLRLVNFKKYLQLESILTKCGDLKPESPIKIEFVDVSFKYPGTGEYILNKLNFSILEGEKVALVGHNGAGKSTIIKLILRFYDPTEGMILVNGRDIHEYNDDELRKCFSVMFQDFASYAFTIGENIALADLLNRDNKDKILDACNKSGVQSFIDKFERGLDTYLTRQFEENGMELSGGEWQKIALARTFFRDGNIVILDEPSSALDPEAEHMIFQKFSELCKGKGAIFISHRMANVTMADRIIVLEKGTAIESGSHSELIKKSGKYAYLFNLQADKYKVG